MFGSSFKSSPAPVPRRRSIDIRSGLKKKNRDAKMACNGCSLKGRYSTGLCCRCVDICVLAQEESN
jgi:hypothetical protein